MVRLLFPKRSWDTGDITIAPRYEVVPLLAIVAAPFLWPVGERAREAAENRTGVIAGQITFASIPPDEFFAPTDAVIYLTGEGLQAAAGAPEPPSASTLLDQIDYTFVPRVLPTLAGTELTFHNGDSELHNIHTYAKGRRANRMFNRGQPPTSTFTATFARPDSILVLCDIHSQMIAHILVLENPYFAMPDEDGSYSIAGVPPGRYQLTAWHEMFDRVSMPVEVVSGETLRIDVTFVSSGG